MDFYGRIFRYRERHSRSPLEDYLTELICFTLQSLSTPVQQAVLHWFERIGGLKEASIPHHLTWRTQVAYAFEEDSGFLDMVAEHDGAPVLLFENKTWSPFSNRSDQASTHQLSRYIEWLSHHGEKMGARALVVMTASTKAPDWVSSLCEERKLHFIQNSLERFSSDNEARLQVV